MLFLLLLAVVFPLTSASVIPETAFKKFCDNYAFPNTNRKYEGSMGGQDDPDRCTVSFDIRIPEEEIVQFCEAKAPFQVNIQKTKENSRNRMAECHYESRSVCTEDEVQIIGRCFVLQQSLDEKCKNGYELAIVSPLESKWLPAYFAQSNANVAWVRKNGGDFQRRDGLNHSDTGKHVLRLKYSNMLPPGYFEEVPKHLETSVNHVLCERHGSLMNAEYKERCDIMRDEFKMKTLMYGGSCYVLSIGVHTHRKGSPDKGQLDEILTMNRDMRTTTKLCSYLGWYAWMAPRYDHAHIKGLNALIESVGDGFGKEVLVTGHSIRPWMNGAHHAQKQQFDFYDPSGSNAALSEALWLSGSAYRGDMDQLGDSAGVSMIRKQGEAQGIPSADIPQVMQTTYFANRLPIACTFGGRNVDIARYKTECAPGWTRFMKENGQLKCIKKLLHENALHYDAAKKCANEAPEGSLEAGLSSIESRRENDVILSLLPGDEPATYHIGGNREEKFEGYYQTQVFTWDDKSPMVFTNHYERYPNGGKEWDRFRILGITIPWFWKHKREDENCLEIVIWPEFPQYHLGWNDHTCYHEQRRFSGLPYWAPLKGSICSYLPPQ